MARATSDGNSNGEGMATAVRGMAMAMKRVRAKAARGMEMATKRAKARAVRGMGVLTRVVGDKVGDGEGG
jgi:hypothetical protein